MAEAEEGRLAAGDIQCLDASLVSVTSDFDRDRISLVLIADAYARQDLQTWETRVQHHLENIDDSNPGLALRYAIHLWVNQGLARDKDVLRWTEAALLNQAAWTGEIYNDRVYSAMKLRAAVGQARWKAAQEALSADPDFSKDVIKLAKKQTRDWSLAWYHFAVETGQDATAAQQLCELAGELEKCRPVETDKEAG